MPIGINVGRPRPQVRAVIDPRFTALIAEQRLPPDYADVVAQWWLPLAAMIADRVAGTGKRPFVVAVSGAQGSGKSTVCAFLELALAERGLPTVTLALDDFYLTRAERARLARDVHPLLEVRGVPGSHDIAAIGAVLDALEQGLAGPIRLPRFDKARDDRAPAEQGHTITGNPAVVLIEGWCLAARPVEAAALAMPVNTLEADEDPDGIWRHYVNAQLAGSYAALFARFDLLVGLVVPDFAEVRRNRGLQEQRLGAPTDTDRRMDDVALDRFLAYYQRITAGLFESLPHDADILVRIGAGHRVLSLQDRRTHSAGR